MPELSALQIVGIIGAASLVIAWLAVSFQRPGSARARTAWVGTTSMYLAFGAFFSGLFQGAREADSLVGMIAFGFLLGVFLAGLSVSAVRTVGAFRKGAQSAQHAAH